MKGNILCAVKKHCFGRLHRCLGRHVRGILQKSHSNFSTIVRLNLCTSKLNYSLKKDDISGTVS